MNKSFIMLLVLVIFLGAGFGISFVGGVIYGQNLAQSAEDELSPRLGAEGQFPGGVQDANAGQRGQARQGQGGPAARQGGGRSLGQDDEVAAARLQGGPVAEGQERGPDDAPVGRIAQRGPGIPESQPQGRPVRHGQGEAPAAQAGSVDDSADSSPGAALAEPNTPGDGASRGAANRGGLVGTVQGLEGSALTVMTPRGELAVALSDSTRVFQVSETGRESLGAEIRVRVLGSRNAEGGIAAQSVVIVPEGMENLFGSGGPGGRQRGQAP